jgi:hypothetical protein
MKAKGMLRNRETLILSDKYEEIGIIVPYFSPKKVRAFVNSRT